MIRQRKVFSQFFPKKFLEKVIIVFLKTFALFHHLNTKIFKQNRPQKSFTFYLLE